MTDKWRQAWLGEAEGPTYGEVLYRRAIGELPEMESARAAAVQLAKIIRNGDHVLDVGCGAGHYLPSLRKKLGVDFHYTGVDATPRFLELARKAFDGDEGVDFRPGDIFALDLPDKSFDVVMSNNVFMHLPSIARPLSELCRVARRRVQVRTLVGDRSFIIKDIADREGDGDEFDEDGEPRAYHYYNIFSRAYVSRLLNRDPRVQSVEIVEDEDFDPARIDADIEHQTEMRDVTRTLAGCQVNGYVIQPWAFICAEMEE